jgi:hypothetical protein
MGVEANRVVGPEAFIASYLCVVDEGEIGTHPLVITSLSKSLSLIPKDEQMFDKPMALRPPPSSKFGSATSMPSLPQGRKDHDNFL